MLVMQYVASIWDETWLLLINIWHYFIDGSLESPMGKPQLLNIHIRIPYNMDEIKKILETYISFL